MTDATINNPATSPVSNSWIYQQLMSIETKATPETYNSIIKNITNLTVSNVNGIELVRLKLYYTDIVSSYAVLLDHEQILPDNLIKKYEKEIIPLKTDKQKGFYMAETELATDDLNLFYTKYDELRATNTSEFFLLANLANFGRTLRCLKKQCYMNGWKKNVIDETNSHAIITQPNTIFQKIKYPFTHQDNPTDENNPNHPNHPKNTNDTNYANPNIRDNLTKIDQNTIPLIGLWTKLLNNFSYIDYVTFVMTYLYTYDKFIYTSDDELLITISRLLKTYNNEIYNFLNSKKLLLVEDTEVENKTNSNMSFKLLQNYITKYSNVFYFIFSHQAFDAITYARFFGTRMMVTNIGFAWVEDIISNLIDSVTHDYFFHNNLHELCYIYDNKLQSLTNSTNNYELITQIDKSTYDVIRTKILEFWKIRNNNYNCINYKNFMFILFYCLFERSMVIVPDYNKKNPSHKIELNNEFDTRYNLAVNIFDAMSSTSKPNYNEILDMAMFNKIKSENTKFKCPQVQPNGGARKTQKHSRAKTQKHNRVNKTKNIRRKKNKKSRVNKTKKNRAKTT